MEQDMPGKEPLNTMLDLNYQVKSDKPSDELTYSSFTTESIKPAFTLLRNRLTRSNSKPLFITIWLGANDATLSFANVPLDKFISNLRTFVTSLLDHPIVKEYGTKIILMTPPPIDVPPPPNPNEPIEKAKTRVGYMTWINKMKYADAVLTLEEEFVQARLEDQVGCVDIWRALINFGLQNEGREKIEPHVQLTEELVLGKRPTGCGLPGTKKFPDRVFIDGLHFDELVSLLNVVDFDIELINAGVRGS
jgi:hypothetical protein